VGTIGLGKSGPDGRLAAMRDRNLIRGRSGIGAPRRLRVGKDKRTRDLTFVDNAQTRPLRRGCQSCRL